MGDEVGEKVDVKKYMKTFLESSTAHGLNKLVSAKKKVNKFLWALVIIGCIAYVSYQTWRLVQEYKRYEVKVDLQIRFKRNPRFPAVTVCNLNILRTSQLQNTRFQELYEMHDEANRLGRRRREAQKEFSGSGSGWNPEEEELINIPVKTSSESPDEEKVNNPANDQQYYIKNSNNRVETVLKSLHNTMPESLVSTTQVPNKQTVPVSTTSNNRFTAINSPETIKNQNEGKHNSRLSVEAVKTVGDLTKQNVIGKVQSDTQYNGIKVEQATSEDSSEAVVSDPSSVEEEPVADDYDDRLEMLDEEPRGRSRRVKRSQSSYSSYNSYNSYSNSYGSGSSSYYYNNYYGYNGYYGSYMYSIYNSQIDYSYLYNLNATSFKDIYKVSQTMDMSDISDTCPASMEEIESMGHQAEDFIVECSFDKKECDSDEFSQFANQKYGNCFTFNNGYNDTDIRHTSKYGSQYGLRLLLNIEINEYMAVYSTSYGARLVVHEPDEYPFPEDMGVSLTPGRHTDIMIKREEIFRATPPHGSCDDKMNYVNLFDDKNTIMSCQQSCAQHLLNEHCGCVSKISRLEGTSKCSPLNQTQSVCMKKIISRFEAGLLDCGEPCKPSCHQVLYPFRASQAIWPTLEYLYLLQMKMADAWNKNPVGHDLSVFPFTYFQDNMVNVHVYYEDLHYQVITESPAYTIERLLSDFGGTLGLFIGASVLTGVEFVTAFSMVILTAFRKLKGRRIVTPTKKPLPRLAKVVTLADATQRPPSSTGLPVSYY